MRAWSRFFTAILILGGFFSIKKYLDHLLEVEGQLHDYRSELSVSVGDYVLTKAYGVVGLDATFATKYRHLQATAATQHEMSATLVSPDCIDRIVVMGKINDEDTSWVRKLPRWKNAVYSVDNDTWPLHTSTNKGREANVYLTYLVENYEKLPMIIAFVHPHERGYPQAWHTDAESYSNVESLSSLNNSFVLSNGYANLRCIAIPGCPDEIQPFREEHGDGRSAEHAFVEAWNQIFGNNDVPKVVGIPCCAQFAVSRDQVHKRPLEFHVGALRWLHDTPLDDATSGRVFEYMWHVIFGQDPMYCPDLNQCYHDVYGKALREGDAINYDGKSDSFWKKD